MAKGLTDTAAGRGIIVLALAACALFALSVPADSRSNRGKKPVIVKTAVGRPGAPPNMGRAEAVAKNTQRMTLKLRNVSDTTNELVGQPSVYRMRRIPGTRTWRADFDQYRGTRCGRMQFIARNGNGRHIRAYKLCIFKLGAPPRTAR